MNTKSILIPHFFEFLTLPPKVYYMSIIAGCMNCKIKITLEKHIDDFLQIVKTFDTCMNLFHNIVVIDLKTNRTLCSEFVAKCKHLKVLKLPKNKFISSDTIVPLTKLKIIDLGDNDNIVFKNLSNFKDLTHITLHSSILIIRDIMLVIKECKQLKILDIGVRMPMKCKYDIKYHLENNVQTIVRLL